MAAQMMWENSCRLCSEEKAEMLPIFGEEGLKRRVPQKLRVFLPLMVYQTDPLPKQICQFCAARLDDVFQFREYCLNVYKNVHLKLMTRSNLNSVKIFLDAMLNSSDPCQVQLCMVKQRAPPPLVPLPSSLTMNDSIPSSVNTPKVKRTNVNVEPLAELPCKVQIKEEPFDITTKPNLFSDRDDKDQSLAHKNYRENAGSDNKYSNPKLINNEKQTSILKQVLTRSSTINDSQGLVPKTKSSFEWWCSSCNNHYQTKENLVKHIQFYCLRRYTCGKCSDVFETVEELTKHETENHSNMNFDINKSIVECHQCNREFVSQEMLKHHRLHDHLAESIEFTTNTWCPLCNLFLPNEELYRNHQQLHKDDRLSDITDKDMTSCKMKKEEKNLKTIKQASGIESTKSLTCSICGKVCAQQNALSNHMRTHELKKFKCDICGQSFGLFIQLAAHRLNEHVQPTVSPVMASIEQEEALNAEREAREAQEKKSNKSNRCRAISEVLDENDLINNEQRSSKRRVLMNINVPRNVAQCDICDEWFNDHTTMLTHLQTHSENVPLKNHTCSICGKIFKEKLQLQRHEVSHIRAEASVHECSICSVSFSDKEQLDAHEKIHIVDKTYYCSKCNKIFFKELSLVNHRCTRMPCSTKRVAIPAKMNQQKSAPLFDDKQFKCLKCPSVFDTAKLGNLHMQIHVESKFSSLDMDLGKDDNNSMPKLKSQVLSSASIPVLEHNNIITENQSAFVPHKRTLIRSASGYRCGVCRSPFVLRDLAVAHLRSAHPVVPYQCPYCKKRFTTKYTFTHHIKTNHLDESEK